MILLMGHNTVKESRLRRMALSNALIGPFKDYPKKAKCALAFWLLFGVLNFINNKKKKRNVIHSMEDDKRTKKAKIQCLIVSIRLGYPALVNKLVVFVCRRRFTYIHHQPNIPIEMRQVEQILSSTHLRIHLHSIESKHFQIIIVLCSEEILILAIELACFQSKNYYSTHSKQEKAHVIMTHENLRIK